MASNKNLLSDYLIVMLSRRGYDSAQIARKMKISESEVSRALKESKST